MSDAITQRGVEFRVEFADEIVRYFGGMFADLHERERAHATGVVANTLAALAVNNAQAVDVLGMRGVMDMLSRGSQIDVGTMVNDDSVRFLFPQSAGICDVIRVAIGERID